MFPQTLHESVKSIRHFQKLLYHTGQYFTGSYETGEIRHAHAPGNGDSVAKQFSEVNTIGTQKTC